MLLVSLSKKTEGKQDFYRVFYDCQGGIKTYLLARDAVYFAVCIYTATFGSKLLRPFSVYRMETEYSY